MHQYLPLILLSFACVALIVVAAWLSLQLSHERANASDRETALHAENARLQHEMEMLTYDPLIVRRAGIFDHIRNYKGD